MIRIESLLKQEISRIIQKDFRSNLGLISITGIKIAKDLSSATIFYSHLGTKNEQKNHLKNYQNQPVLLKAN